LQSARPNWVLGLIGCRPIWEWGPTSAGPKGFLDHAQ
jgi:hypothetical protein